jgi:hypothetical protein
MTAVLGYYTLMDVVNSYTSLDSQASYVFAANVLARKCPFFMDAPMVPSNQIMSNIGARVTYIPSPGTRRFNEGVAPSAAHSTPFTDPIAMIEDYSEVDYALWRIQNDPNRWRQNQDKLKIEGMTQKAEDLIIYGSLADDPGAFNGFATRYNSLTKRPNGDSTWPYCVIGTGGSGSDTTSIFMIEWGEEKVHFVYPKNLVAGLNIEDLGKETVNSNSLAAPKYFEALRTHFSLYFGLVIHDERCVQRITNIEVSGTSNIFDEEDLFTAMNRLPNGGDGAVIYCNRDIKTAMDIAASNKTNVLYQMDMSGDVFGRPVTRFRGVPVRLADMIDSTETVVA